MTLLVAFLLPSVSLGDDKADLAALQGDWKTRSAKRGGKDAPPAIQESTMRVEKNTFTLISIRNGKERKEPINVKLDSSKTPRQIDLIDKGGKVENHGIYKIEGKKFTLCFARAREPRPKTFESKVGSKTYLMVFERTKK
jgi:uncharacterized protein (TIGR03067 family)